ncbi:MAG: type ISP restriction/modification enzyme [Microthrixaceae bacterium]
MTRGTTTAPGEKLDSNVERMIDHYNSQVDVFKDVHPGGDKSTKARAEAAKAFVDLDPKKFSWDRANFTDIAKGVRYREGDRLVLEATYRPFHRRWVEAGRRLNNTVYQLPRIFPNADAENLTIGVHRRSAAEFAFRGAHWYSDLPDVDVWVDPTPSFPRYIYDLAPSADAAQAANAQGELFSDAGTDSNDTDGGDSGQPRRHNVTDHALALYRTLDSKIDKDDVFFYVYGILHSPDYRSAFAADLKKSLPRIPQVDNAEDFWGFSNAGRELAELHTDYEDVEPWPDLAYEYATGADKDDPATYRVTKMKHPKVKLDGESVEDRTRIIYNEHITIGNIPEAAYGYELGSRSAIGWVMEAWRVRTDKASGIVNDPNDWATEHNDPTYILDLIGRVVTVSMRTIEIVEGLPKLSL